MTGAVDDARSAFAEEVSQATAKCGALWGVVLRGGCEFRAMFLECDELGGQAGGRPSKLVE